MSRLKSIDDLKRRQAVTTKALCDRITELEAQLAKFTPYINHTPECIAHEPSYKSQCDCGLSEVIDTSQESE